MPKSDDIAGPRRVAGGAALLAVALCCTTTSTAQQAPEDGSAIPEIVVTGSHIERGADDGPAPVEVFDAENIASTGVNTLQDFARYLPFNAGVPNDEQLAASSAPGTNFFNLRGIGEHATLTLINGRRIAPYGSPQSNGHTFVDLNSIPLAAIERIEVLKDGASAIYGSDAIAGVVNIVTKQRFDGLTAGAGYLSTTRGDAGESSFDVLWGKPLGTSHFVIAGSYFRRRPMASVDRKYLAEMDLRPVGGRNNRSGFSSPMTAFLPSRRRAEAEPACPDDDTHPLAFVVPIRQPHSTLDSLCTMNQKLFTNSIPESERAGLSGYLSYVPNSTTSYFMDLLFSHGATDSRLAPPITDRTPIAGAQFPIADADHPGNPYDVPVAMSYSVIDAGSRRVKTRSRSARFAAGLTRDRTRLSWDAGVVLSESDVDTRHVRPIDSVLFQDALLGLGGPDGDQYYDPFGLYPDNPAEVIAAFQVPQSLRNDRMREAVADLGIRGTWLELGGGSARWALGGQLRWQRGTSSGDAFQTSGRALGINLLRPMRASRNIGAAYIELAAPVDDRLELQLALRHERYSDFGGSTHPKVAARVDLADDLALRISYGTSFRAPTFVELFRTPIEGQAFLVDTTRCDVTGAPVDCVRFPYITFSSGNRDLAPEQGRSWYGDLTWTPPTSPKLRFNLGFWRFEHEERILDVDAQFIVDNFGSDSSLVLRGEPAPTDPPGTPGPIEQVNTRPLNLELLHTEGFDLGISFSGDNGAATSMSANASLSYVYDYVFDAAADSPLIRQNLAGKAELFPLPRLRGNLGVTWQHAGTRITATLHYVRGYRSPLNMVVGGTETDTSVYIDNHVTADLQFVHSFARGHGTGLQFGCQNCTDEKPPVYNYTWTGEQLHDPRGAMLYARLTQTF